MCSKELGADYVYAWPFSEMAVMGSKAAIDVLYRKASAEEKEEQLKLEIIRQKKENKIL